MDNSSIIIEKFPPITCLISTYYIHFWGALLNVLEYLVRSRKSSGSFLFFSDLFALFSLVCMLSTGLFSSVPNFLLISSGEVFKR